MDIYIPVKESFINEELRYTLRSICANFPHNKIWIVGYKPTWLVGDVHHIPGNNAVGHKYAKVVKNHLAAMTDPRLTDDIYLFNDDFFVMKPVDNFENRYRCPIDDSIERLRNITKTDESTYLKSLLRTKEILTEMGVKNIKDYGLHIPLKINRKQWLEAWKAQAKLNPNGDIIHMRTIYGNLFLNFGGFEKMGDVKITTLDEMPDPESTFLSTVDTSFISGKVGEYIRSTFSKACKCEGAVSNTFML